MSATYVSHQLIKASPAAHKDDYSEIRLVTEKYSILPLELIATQKLWKLYLVVI